MIAFGFYKHYKNGKHYEVKGVSIHQDKRKKFDGKPIVLYSDMETGVMYTRFQDDFEEKILINGKTAISRFAFMGTDKKKISVDVSDIPSKPKGKMLNS